MEYYRQAVLYRCRGVLYSPPRIPGLANCVINILLQVLAKILEPTKNLTPNRPQFLQPWNHPIPAMRYVFPRILAIMTFHCGHPIFGLPYLGTREIRGVRAFCI